MRGTGLDRSGRVFVAVVVAAGLTLVVLQMLPRLLMILLMPLLMLLLLAH